jgi:hypothetical protein
LTATAHASLAEPGVVEHQVLEDLAAESFGQISLFQLERVSPADALEQPTSSPPDRAASEPATVPTFEEPKLLREPPLIVLPSLATEVGLTEAIVLQQIHFRGRITAKGWWRAGPLDLQREFPFLSPATIKRALTRLRRADLVKVRKAGGDRTNRYRIDYTALAKRLPVVPGQSDLEGGKDAGQIDPCPSPAIGSDRPDPVKEEALTQEGNVIPLRKRSSGKTDLSHYNRALQR